MTEEQRAMIQGMDAFMKRLELSFRKDEETLKKIRSVCDQAYYDIVFDESHPLEDKQFNVFNIRTTEEEKQELSSNLYRFHTEYENSFADYFDESEELEDFLYWYKGFYELIDKLLDRW